MTKHQLAATEPMFAVIETYRGEKPFVSAVVQDQAATDELVGDMKAHQQYHGKVTVRRVRLQFVD